MEIGGKMLIAAVLSLLIGVAFASPLLISEIAKPFPVVPEGPKADISVEIIYANFSIQEATISETVNAGTSSSYTKAYPSIDVTYMVVLNITNLSDIEAKLSEVSFAAAENISVISSALGGYSFELYTGGQGANFGGVVKGVWLDGEWVNTTWIPGIDYPFNLLRVVTPDHEVSASIPDLLPNASETGTWIEGVPIGEYYGNNTLERTQIYINGAWVDVTGRITLNNTQPTVMATNTLATRLQNFGGLGYRNVGNASVGPITELPSWQRGNGGPSLTWINTAGFSNVWAPHQSRLIMLTSTLTYIFTEDTQRINIDSAIDSLKAGTITLYGSASSYVTNWLVEGTYYDTISTATYLQKVNMEDSGNGYIYNAALAHNQFFQPDQNGIEVFIATKES